MRRALVVGIDDLALSPCKGCVIDAVEITSKLETNGDGSPNFDIVRMTSNDLNISSAALMATMENLFSGDADTVLFYFAGHGIINPVTNAGYIVTQDGKKPNWGISLSDILQMANVAYDKIRASLSILSSGHPGLAG